MLRPNFTPFPFLTTARLVLREMTLTDAPGLFRLRSNEEVMKYINRPLTKTIEEAQTWIGMIVSSLQKGDGITWCMALKEYPSESIGNIGIWRIEKENYRGEVGYMIEPAYQGKGLMSEAIQAVVEYGFRQMHLHSLEGHIDPRNIASGRLLEKSGFVREAYFKENYFLRGSFADTAVYSQLSPYPPVIFQEQTAETSEVLSS